MNNIYTGLGKRKTAIVKVFLKLGSGIIRINNHIQAQDFLKKINKIFHKSCLLLDIHAIYDIDIKVRGGGYSAQLIAINLGISRALSTICFNNQLILREHGLLRRDTRIKERRKYGLKKARKAPQFSKR